MKKFWKLTSVVLLLLIVSAFPAHAGTMDVTGFTGMSGDCTSNLAIYHNFSIAGTTVDVPSTNRDVIALVLYDGGGTAFAYISIGVNVGYSGTISGYGWNYPILRQPRYRPFTMKIYDNTTVVTTADANLSGAQHGSIVDTRHFDPANFGVCEDLPYVVRGGNENPDLPVFYDGRINNYDTGNPVVIYGNEFERGRGLVVYSPQGDELLVVRPEEIAAVPECPDENTLIAGDDETNVWFYRLVGCSYQVNALTIEGKTYVIIFTELYANAGYTSYEIP